MGPLKTAPLWRPVTSAEAALLSPWPDRIAGRTPWNKPARALQEIIDEYDRGWYATTLEAWRRYLEKHEGRSVGLHGLRRFVRDTRARVAESMAAQAVIYGRANPGNHLVSAGDELYCADFVWASDIHYGLVQHVLGGVFAECGSDMVVELGCGDGTNLVEALSTGVVQSAYGGEICPNALTLLQSMARAGSDGLRPFPFDFRRPDGLRVVLSGDRPWVLLTVHALEQLEAGVGDVVDSVLSLPHRPVRVVHLEPSMPPEAPGDSAFDRACRKYALINRYIGDLFSVLSEREAQGRLRVLRAERKLFGLSAFNPTNCIVWQPI